MVDEFPEIRLRDSWLGWPARAVAGIGRIRLDESSNGEYGITVAFVLWKHLLGATLFPGWFCLTIVEISSCVHAVASDRLQSRTAPMPSY